MVQFQHLPCYPTLLPSNRAPDMVLTWKLAGGRRLKLEHSCADLTLLFLHFLVLRPRKFFPPRDVLYILMGVVLASCIPCNLEVKLKAKGPT